ncbi:hypothetical protein JCM6882_006553 [Rhodosporidiobolus microsporus]
MSTPPSSVHHPPPSDAPDSDDTPADSSLFDELIERTGGGATMALERRGEEVMPLHLAFGREVGKKRKRKRRDGEFDGGKKRRKGEKGKGRRKRERIEGLTRITPSLPPLPAPPPPTSAMAFTKRARLLSAARGGEVKGFDEEKEELGRRFEGAMRRFDELLGRSSRHFALTSAPIKRYADGELKQRAEAATAGLSALRGYFAGGEEKKAEKEL